MLHSFRTPPFLHDEKTTTAKALILKFIVLQKTDSPTSLTGVIKYKSIFMSMFDILFFNFHLSTPDVMSYY